MILIVLMKKIQVYEYDCVLLDITLPSNGLDLIKTIKNSRQKQELLLFLKIHLTIK
jgi:DNA-binding response OmpR family regulator